MVWFGTRGACVHHSFAVERLPVLGHASCLSTSVSCAGAKRACPQDDDTNLPAQAARCKVYGSRLVYTLDLLLARVTAGRFEGVTCACKSRAACGSTEQQLRRTKLAGSPAKHPWLFALLPPSRPGLIHLGEVPVPVPFSANVSLLRQHHSPHPHTARQPAPPDRQQATDSKIRYRSWSRLQAAKPLRRTRAAGRAAARAGAMPVCEQHAACSCAAVAARSRYRPGSLL